MAQDKYTAVWLSHSSISDFLRCPRAYYLKNVYKDPATNHKIKLTNPSLSLGQAVHDVLENLYQLPTADRLKDNLLDKFANSWKKVTGEKGGFTDPNVEHKYRSRGEDMIRRVQNNPGPILNPAVKINMDLPFFWLSEPDNIILCGKIDWLEYLADTDSVHIIDFKTSKGEEDPDSLQLPIYCLLVANCQKRQTTKASYWYLDRSDAPESKPLPDPVESQHRLLEIGKKIKLARSLEHFKCPTGGCSHCQPFEAILRGEAKLVGTDDYRADVYILDKPNSNRSEDSFIH